MFPNKRESGVQTCSLKTLSLGLIPLYQLRLPHWVSGAGAGFTMYQFLEGGKLPLSGLGTFLCSR